MAFLAEMLPGLIGSVLPSLLGPTLNRVGTKFDAELAPKSYGQGKKRKSKGGGKKIRSNKKVAMAIPYQMTKRCHEGLGMYNRRGCGVMVDYGPRNGGKRRGKGLVVPRDEINNGALP